MNAFCLRICIAILVLSPAWAQPTPTPKATPIEASASQGSFRVTVSAPRNRFELGQSQRLLYRIEGPADGQVDLPEVGKLDLKPFEMSDSAISALPPQGDRRTWEVRLKVAAYDTGSLKLPGVPLQVSPGGQANNTTLTPPVLQFEVDRVPAREGDEPDMVRDAKGLSQHGVPWVVWLAGLLTLALLGLLAWLIRRWWKRPRKQALVPQLDPYPQALRDLAALAASQINKQGQWQEFYDRLSQILRRYLGWRYHVPLLEQTTSESMRSLSLSEQPHRRLKEILENADLVKFAKMYPPLEQSEHHLSWAKELIESNAPPEEGAKTS